MCYRADRRLGRGEVRKDVRFYKYFIRIRLVDMVVCIGLVFFLKKK